MNRTINLRFGLLVLLVFVAALSRLLPHPPNVTAIGASALFGAAYFTRKHLALLVPLAAMWVSDLLLNNLVYARFHQGGDEAFHWFGSLWVYLSFVLIALLGMGLLKRITVPRLLGASLSASVLFFLLTNFGSWLGNPTYPQNAAGLLTSYVMGLPFFWNTLLGDLFFTVLLFGIFEWMQARLPALRSRGAAI